MPTPKLPEAKRARILELHRQGLNSPQIIKLAKVSIGTVANVLRDAGIKSHRARTSKENHRKVHESVKAGGSFEKIGKRVGMSYSQAKVLAAKPLPVEPEPVKPMLPAPLSLSYEPFVIGEAGQWLILCDIHIPCHDRVTLELAVKEAKRRKVVGVILNGDTLDSHEVSDHIRDPSALRYADEIEQGKQFLSWLRKELPHAQIVFKEGNHEERVQRYLIGRAPAIEGLEGVNLPAWLHMRDFGIEFVGGKRIIRLGKLHVLHGHELRGGGGVNPARWLYLKARSVAVCGHFHRTSEHHERNIAMKYEAAWSIGCACYLHPAYAPVNNWNHGCGFVELDSGGGFALENKRVFDGRLI